jgi:hypothetical protein
MNTAKILDVLPQASAAAPAPAVPASRPEPRAVPPVGTGATTDMIDQEREHRVERDAQAAAAQERKRQATRAATPPSFNREVGLVEDSFQVFVDLVSPSTGSHRVRIFGPPDHGAAGAPPAPTGDPASARAAYAGGRAGPLPAATIKADV